MTQRKYIGQTYRITFVQNESLWAGEAAKLLSYRGRLETIGKDQFYGLKMLNGPLQGQVIFLRCRLRLVPDTRLCYCKAYGFPHRAGSGKCLDGKGDMFCEQCGDPCTASWKDTGIGSYEYWGQKCRDTRSEYLSDCCDAEVYSDASLTHQYLPED